MNKSFTLLSCLSLTLIFPGFMKQFEATLATHQNFRTRIQDIQDNFRNLRFRISESENKTVEEVFSIEEIDPDENEDKYVLRAHLFCSDIVTLCENKLSALFPFLKQEIIAAADEMPTDILVSKIKTIVQAYIMLDPELKMFVKPVILDDLRTQDKDLIIAQLRRKFDSLPTSVHTNYDVHTHLREMDQNVFNLRIQKDLQMRPDISCPYRHDRKIFVFRNCLKYRNALIERQGRIADLHDYIRLLESRGDGQDVVEFINSVSDKSPDNIIKHFLLLKVSDDKFLKHDHLIDKEPFDFIAYIRSFTPEIIDTLRACHSIDNLNRHTLDLQEYYLGLGENTDKVHSEEMYLQFEKSLEELKNSNLELLGSEPKVCYQQKIRDVKAIVSHYKDFMPVEWYAHTLQLILTPEANAQHYNKFLSEYWSQHFMRIAEEYIQACNAQDKVMRDELEQTLNICLEFGIERGFNLESVPSQRIMKVVEIEMPLFVKEYLQNILGERKANLLRG